MALFLHDCESCVYLGPYYAYTVEDLYWCPLSPTVISRFGSDGPDYTSGLGHVGLSDALSEAFGRAFRRGLITVTSSNIGNEFGTFNIPSTEEETA